MRGVSTLILLACVLALATAAHAGKVVLSNADVAYIQSPDPPYEGRYLARFALPETLSHCTVELAVLELRLPVTCPGEMGTVAVDVFPLTAEWDAATADWTQGWDAPGGDFDMSLHAGWGAKPGQNSLMRFDVTDAVSAWASDDMENRGLLIAADPDDGRLPEAEDSRGAGGPILEVYYTERGTASR
jgi:hypothetical protein